MGDRPPLILTLNLGRETFKRGLSPIIRWTSGGDIDYTWNIGVSAVPITSAVWLFSSGLIGLIGVARRKKA
jgi:hypothetical protein